MSLVRMTKIALTMISTSKQCQNNEKFMSFNRFFILVGLASTIITIYLYLSFINFEPTLQVSLTGWERNRSRDIATYILPNENTTIVQPTMLCKEKTPILLLVVICSGVGNFERRQAIRKTWANTTIFNYSKFLTLHSKATGEYLPINYNNWTYFTTKSSENNSNKESSKRSSKTPNDTTQEKQPSHVDFQIRTVFLVGQSFNSEMQKKILVESRTHNDLIQESFLDSYNNLTLKSVMMLKWINQNCDGKVKYSMKCDDDTFVNVPNLIHVLLGGTVPAYKATRHHYNELTMDTLSPKNRLTRSDLLLIGQRIDHAEPITDYKSKWYAPHYLYDKKVYPTYLSGSGYVFAMETARKLYNASLQTPLFYLEDVYVTGMCAENGQIEPMNHHLFELLPYSDWCEFRGMITLHRISASDMYKAHDFLMNPNSVCDVPSSSFIARIFRSGYAVIGVWIRSMF